jgi:hypothetical protein
VERLHIFVFDGAGSISMCVCVYVGCSPKVKSVPFIPLLMYLILRKAFHILLQLQSGFARQKPRRKLNCC